jgi:hypothetical protein
MRYDELRSDYDIRQNKKRKLEQARQRKVIRYQDVAQEEVRKQGSELLHKIVAAIPKYFNVPGQIGGWHKPKEGVVFLKDKQVIRISLALRPSPIVDYVIGAFLTKGWKAKHTFNDLEGHDFLDLSLPEDWLQRVLRIGIYSQPKQDKPEEETPREHA